MPDGWRWSWGCRGNPPPPLLQALLNGGETGASVDLSGGRAVALLQRAPAGPAEGHRRRPGAPQPGHPWV